jgi:general secretion pathway protein C
MMLGAIVQRGWSKLARNAPRVVSIMLGTLVAAELGHTALVLSPLVGVGSLEAKPGGAEGLHDQIRPGRVDAGRIIEAHLFGDEAKNIPAEPASDADAPPTSASLRLTGTIAAADPKRGTAIISDAGKSAVYLIGADVGGASVYAVYVDRVILNRGGQLESLLMPHSATTGAGSAQYADKNSGVGKTAVPADSIADGKRGLADVMRVGASVGNDTGQVRGFHIYPGKDRSAFTDAGLHGGDLVVAVNGVSVLEENRRDGRDTFSAVENADRATMTIERFGRTTDVTIDVAQAGTSEGATPTNVVQGATSVP